MSETQKPSIPPAAKNAKGIVSSLVGGAVGIYSGINLLIPLAFSGAVWFVGSKLLKPRDMAYLTAIAIQSGHLFWLAVGSAILGNIGFNAFDIVIMGVGIAWLWLRPGLWPVVFLSVFQALALVINVMVIASEPMASIAHKALVVHIALRLAALFYMWQVLVNARRQQASIAANDF